MSHHDYQVFSLNLGVLKGLPVVSRALLTQRAFSQMPDRSSESAVSSIIEWMKALEIIYSLGTWQGHQSRNEKFFVPFLATEALSDDAPYKWDWNLAEELSDDTALVLYAALHSHVTDHFFHRLIASLLSDALANAASNPQCYINLGCKEAMLPLFYTDRLTASGEGRGHRAHEMVLLRYHPIQNFIEFRKKRSVNYYENCSAVDYCKGVRQFSNDGVCE